MSRRYATLDQLTLPTHLELQQGDLVCTFNADSTGSDRNARATETLSGGRWAWACAAWGTEALTGDNVRFGILNPSVANNVRLGDAAGTISCSPGDGTIRVNNVVVATVAAIGAQRWLLCALDLVSGTPTLQFITTGGLVLYTVALTAGQSWIPAISIGGTTAYGLSGILNFGLEPLDIDAPANYKPGVFINTATGGSEFFSNIAHRNPPTGSPPNQLFQGVILDAKNVSIESGIAFWPDGQSGMTFGASDVDLNNENGKLGYLLKDQPRNAPIIWELVDLDHLEDDPIRYGTTRVDRITEPKRGVIRIKQASPLAIYDDAWARKTIPPWADAGNAGQVWPYAAGAVRNCGPVPFMLNAGSPTYLVHLQALTKIGVVRDRGDAFDPTRDPPDYTPTFDLRGIIQQTQPVGKYTADVSSSGTSTLTPVSPTDLLGGVGNMATPSGGAGSMPTGWTNASTSGFATRTISQVSTDGGRMNIVWSAWSGVASIMNANADVRAAATIVAADRYRISVDVKSLTKGAHFRQGGLSAQLVDSGGTVHDLAGAIWGSLDVGNYKVDFTAPVAAVAIQVRASVSVDGNTTTSNTTAQLDNITVVQLPSAPGADADLEGTRLVDFMEGLIEQQFGGRSTDWVRTDAEDIDTAKPYPFGVFSKAAVTKIGILRAPFPSLGLCEAPDEFGRLRLALLQDPALMTPVTTVTFAQANTPIGDPDQAQKLTINGTTRYNWEISGDSDFVDNYDSVTGIDAETRARFKRQGQFIVKSSANMPDLYLFARGAPPLNMLLDLEADANAQHNSICKLYEQPRINYSLSFSYAWPPTQILRPGQAIAVQCDWGEFVAGKNLLIKRLKHYMLSCKYEISVGWG